MRTMSTVDFVPQPMHTSQKAGEPAWDLALMYPLQGGWTVEQYLRLDGGLLVEYTDGFIQVLPMPNLLHQWIVRLLFRELDQFANQHAAGEVLLAPLPVALTRTTYREPDIVLLRPGRIKSWHGQPSGADLVVEVVSEGRENRERDYVQKRREYAAAGIAEYWIVDPQQRTITVLGLDRDEYREFGVYQAGDIACSVLLPGFTCDVKKVFAKCDEA